MRAAYLRACLRSMNPSTCVCSHSTRSEPERGREGGKEVEKERGRKGSEGRAKEGGEKRE